MFQLNRESLPPYHLLPYYLVILLTVPKIVPPQTHQLSLRSLSEKKETENGGKEIVREMREEETSTWQFSCKELLDEEVVRAYFSNNNNNFLNLFTNVYDFLQIADDF